MQQQIDELAQGRLAAMQQQIDELAQDLELVIEHEIASGHEYSTFND